MTGPGTIRSNDRVLKVGKTGSGKSHAAIELIWDALPRVVFYDWKAQHHNDLNAPTVRSLEELRFALLNEDPEERLDKVVYVPPATEKGLEEFDAVCKTCWDRQGIHLLVDEMKGIYQQGGGVKAISDWHEAILTRGREPRRVGITQLTQRPKKIPLEAISESEHIFAFRLNLSDDRDRISEVAGEVAGSMIEDLKGHQFVYYHPHMDEPQRCDPL